MKFHTFQKALASISITAIILLFLSYLNKEHNIKMVHENIERIDIGMKTDSALQIMKENTLFLKYSIQPCDDCTENKQFTYVIIFPYIDDRLSYYEHTKVYYDTRTNRVTGASSGATTF